MLHVQSSSSDLLMEERKSPFNGVKGKKKTSSEIVPEVRRERNLSTEDLPGEKGWLSLSW
jgi:hypothetical protein